MDRRAFVVLLSLTRIKNSLSGLRIGKTGAGFTLIELIISMTVLTILAGLLFGPFDDLYTSNTRNLKSIVQVGDTRSALRAVQQQVELSNGFLASNSVSDPLRSTAWSWTGSSTTDRVLITSSYATTTSGVNKQILTTGSPACTPEINNSIYFVDNRVLYRRTLTNNNNSVTPCAGGSWDQRHTCAPRSTNARCQGSDAKLADNVTAFSVQYYDSSYSGTPLSSPTGATTVMLTLTTDAGDGPVTSKMRITKANG